MGKAKEREVNLERESLVYGLLHRDDWRTVDAIESFLYVYDKMPPMMKMVIDYKMTGDTTQEIADKLSLTTNAVRIHVYRAKKRILNALY